AGTTGIRKDDHLRATLLERAERFPSARVGAAAVMQDAELIDENDIERAGDRQEAREGHGYAWSWRRTSCATPTQASCDRADAKGVFRTHCLIALQPLFLAPPPTVRMERSSGAPSSPSLR